MSDQSSELDPVETLADEFVARVRGGEHPSIGDYADRHPALAERIRELFPALIVMEQLGAVASRSTRPVLDQAGDSLEMPLQLGDYRLICEVGRGGMGVVYEAVQESLGRRVALKVFPCHGALTGPHLERFRREARAAARLHHDHIVPVFDFDQQQGLAFYAMQFIQGQSLDNVLMEVKRLRQPRSLAPFDPWGPEVRNHLAACLLAGKAFDAWTSEGQSRVRGGKASRELEFYYHSVAQIGVQVADALDYAHHQGILHRDIKPSNLLLDERGHVWISDFGLAKADESDELTRSGELVGTLRFMAPERFNGWADPRSDVYALGITLYELLTLQPVFADGSRARLVARVQQEEPARPRKLDPNIPPDLETIVCKAIAKEPVDRYASAAALADDLRRFLNDQPIQARPNSLVERLWRWRRRNPSLAGLTAAVIVSLAMGMVASSVLAYVARQQAKEAEINARIANWQRDRARKNAEEANAQKEKAERRLYIADLRLGQRAYDDAQMGRLRELLDGQRPARTGGVDYRGFEHFYLDRQAHADLFTLTGHAGPVLCVAYSPDGRRIASGDREGLVKIWKPAATERDKPELLDTLPAQPTAVQAVAFSPDGKRLASASIDLRTSRHPGNLIVWDLEDGRKLFTIPAKPPITFGFTAVVFSPDGQRLAVATTSGVFLFDAATGKELLTIAGQTLVALSPDGQRLATLGAHGTVIVCDTSSGEVLSTHAYPAAGKTVTCLAFSPDGVELAAGLTGREVYLWNTVAEAKPRVLTLEAMVRSLAFSSDGRRLAFAGDSRIVQVFDRQTGKEIVAWKGHDGTISGLAFEGNGPRLASASWDGTVKVWDSTRRADVLPVSNRERPTHYLAYRPHTRHLALLGNDLLLWDEVSQAVVQKLHPKLGGHRGLAFSPDGRTVAVAGGSALDKNVVPRVLIYDLTSGREVWVLRDSRVVQSVAFSPDGAKLATMGGGAVKLWDLSRSSDEPPSRTWKASTSELGCLAFSPDGRWLAYLTSYRDIEIIDVATGETIFALHGHAVGVTGLAFRPDGKCLASSSYDQTVRLWDLSDSRQAVVASRCTLKGHTGEVICLAFAPDGKRLASGSWDTTVRLWDVENGQETLTLKGHTNRVTSVVFSPDGHRLLSTSWDKTVRVWDATPVPKEGP